MMEVVVPPVTSPPVRTKFPREASPALVAARVPPLRVSGLRLKYFPAAPSLRRVAPCWTVMETGEKFAMALPSLSVPVLTVMEPPLPMPAEFTVMSPLNVAGWLFRLKASTSAPERVCWKTMAAPGSAVTVTGVVR